MSNRTASVRWPEQLRHHARSHTKSLAGLGVAIIGLIWLWSLAFGNPSELGSTAITLALLGGGAGFASTALGAAPALLMNNLNARTEDVMLGTAAGMMLAAASFSLILPGLEAGAVLTDSAIMGAGLVVVGMAAGVLLMLGLDAFTPHEHFKTGPCGPGHERCARVWLFVFAIALHNLPEGMAVGFGFSKGDITVGLPLALAISLQNLPEGLAVAMSLRSIGMRPLHALLVTAATGLLEPVGALIGVSLVGGSALAYPVGLGLAAGAMLFVVSHEVIPETHRNNHQTPATIGLMVGFAVMMVLDSILG
ncbi:ZIP family metal transporter [Orrella marina]|uniref:ZIP family metal transporter n=1 Tax=Orrella marina TaxID=2163011 RepID=A0A2R4XIE9_9BURK|nr:ZIP family metal transporter [Orrella marina]AWB33580.1 hypothetical protein DBV39_07520 [Orrella marina]